jgi:hypothetical protein
MTTVSTPALRTPRPDAQVSPDLSCVRRWPSDDARRGTQRFVEEACADPDVEAVVAIGSAVRPVGRERSDVDFVVIRRGDAPRRPPRHIEVDVRTFPAARVEAQLAAGHDLLGWAVVFGVAVCQKERYWQRLAERWRGRVPLPSAAVAWERADRSARLARELEAMGDRDATAEQVVTTLTHRARAKLIEAKVYPASRPELPGQLRGIGEVALAARLQDALDGKPAALRWSA